MFLLTKNVYFIKSGFGFLAKLSLVRISLSILDEMKFLCFCITNSLWFVHIHSQVWFQQPPKMFKIIPMLQLELIRLSRRLIKYHLITWKLIVTICFSLEFDNALGFRIIPIWSIYLSTVAGSTDFTANKIQVTPQARNMTKLLSPKYRLISGVNERHRGNSWRVIHIH